MSPYPAPSGAPAVEPPPAAHLPSAHAVRPPQPVTGSRGWRSGTTTLFDGGRLWASRQSLTRNEMPDVANLTILIGPMTVRVENLTVANLRDAAAMLLDMALDIELHPGALLKGQGS